MFCPKCGNEYEGNPAFCKNCGSALSGLPAARTSTGQFKSVRGVATVLVVAFCIVILVDAIAAVIDIQRIGLLSRIISGGNWTIEEADASDAAFSASGIAQLVAFIATAVVFLVWIFRAYKNLESLGSRNPRYSAGWAIGWFFIPVASLWMPFQVTKEIWKASDPKSTDGVSWHNSTVPLLVPAWWVLYIVSNIVQYIVGRVAMSEAETAAEFLNQTWAWLISDVLEIPAAILAVLVVWGITSRQDEKNRNLVSTAPVAGQWTNQTYQA